MISLDVGCGHREYDVRRGTIGIDLERGKADIIADAHFLPFKDSIFDKVFCYHLIEHCFNSYKVIQELKRVTLFKGIIEISTPNAMYLYKVLRTIFLGSYIVSEDHIQTYGITELKHLINKCGLEIKKIQYVYYASEKDKPKLLDHLAIKIGLGRNIILYVIKK